MQCITNAVTVNDCANILLAAGASPTMAHHPQEAAEISAGCDALLCNFGAIADYEAMKSAALMATRLGASDRDRSGRCIRLHLPQDKMY